MSPYKGCQRCAASGSHAEDILGVGIEACDGVCGVVPVDGVGYPCSVVHGTMGDVPRSLVDTRSPAEGGFVCSDALHDGVGRQAGKGTVACHDETDVVLLDAGADGRAGCGGVDVGAAPPMYRLPIFGGIECGRQGDRTRVVVKGNHHIAHSAIVEQAVEMDGGPRIGRTAKCAGIDQLQLRQGNVVERGCKRTAVHLAHVEAHITRGAAIGGVVGDGGYRTTAAHLCGGV